MNQTHSPARLLTAVFALGAILPALAQSPWSPVPGHLMTRWAAQVSPDNVWPEYPRPQMVRKDWRNLNGLWDYAVVPSSSSQPREFDGKILVPFSLESALSGVKKPLRPDQALWYRRLFDVPPAWRGQRILLHFGAVDWHTTVWVNNRLVGEHKGGFTPFSFDITDALQTDPTQELVVKVLDPTDTGLQPRGKQVREPEGIWYTSVSGIWQTVWLEPVPPQSIELLTPVPDIDRRALSLSVATRGNASALRLRATAFDGPRQVARADGPAGAPLTLSIPAPKLWSPESPHLYQLKVELRDGSRVIDQVDSYFGMRKVSLGKDPQGYTRIFLNNKPYFHLGPLDQGWWPDGLYTAPTDEALRYDIEITRRLGFNMARKHVKVEPARWYYYCDRLGLLVWQDMPNGNLHRAPGNNLRVRPTDAQDAARPPDSAAQFETELAALIRHFSHFPSIIMWVPFNEGWGQYDTPRIAALTKKLDPSRLVNPTSGWTDRGVGDVYDVHLYPGPGMKINPGPGRASVLGEFGGLGWPVEHHLWWNKRNWGYRTFTNAEDLRAKYRQVLSDLRGLLGFGLSAAVYTQTTDVEGEVNGLMTYDRAIIKFNPDDLRALHEALYRAAPNAVWLAASSELSPQLWHISTEEPPVQWRSETPPAGWRQAPAPFASPGYPILSPATPWESPSLWLVRLFELSALPTNLWLAHCNEVDEGELYINGRLVFSFSRDTATDRHHSHTDISRYVSALKPGRNVMAIHVTKGEGRKVIDAGLYTLQ